MIKKSLKELSWNVTESEYRSNNAISYSNLSTFFRNGPLSIINKEEIESDAIRFGSLFDCMLTSPEEFHDRFYVVDSIMPSPAVVRTIKSIYLAFGEEYQSLSDIGDKILQYIEEEEWQSNWKAETKIKKMIEAGSDYYNVLKYSSGKIIVSIDEYNDALKCLSEVRTNPFTARFFDSEEQNEIERLFQLKFITEINGINVRCMFDEIVVDHKNKTIEPLDIKTTGKKEVEFNASFHSWCYWIQASMYWDILRKKMNEDSYFRHFELLPFKFLAINKKSISPIIWDCDDMSKLNTAIINKYGKPWTSLADDYSWHIKNNSFKYPKNAYLNNGCLKLTI